MNLKTFSLALVPVVSCVALYADQPAATPSVGKDVIAMVGDSPMTLAEFDRVMSTIPPDAEYSDHEIYYITRRTLRKLIDKRLFENYAADHADRVDPKQLKQKVEDKLKEWTIEGMTLEESLKQAGVTREDVERNVRAIILRKRLTQEATTDDKLWQFYNDYPHLFDGTAATVQHIMIFYDPYLDSPDAQKAAMDKAKRLRKQIIDGEISFAEAARLHSDDDGSRDKGGKLGRFRRISRLGEEFSKAAWALERGEVSPIVASHQGLHLIRLVSMAELPVPSFKEAKGLAEMEIQRRLMLKITEEQSHKDKVRVLLDLSD